MGFNFPSSPTLDQPFSEFGIAWFYNGYAWRLVKVTGDPTLALDLDFTTGTLDGKVSFTRTTTATYTNSSGVIASAAINAPRFDHDPVTLVSRGLLIEEQRTNHILRSADLANAAWGQFTNGSGTCTATANAAVAPDGTTTACLLAINRSDAGTEYAYRNQVGLGLPFAGYAGSIWLKAKAAGDVGKSVTLGVASASAWQTPVNAVLTADWVRYSIIVGIDPAQFGVGYIAIAGQMLQTGPVEFYAWGGQFEPGAFATSYIPTTSATVTRAADIAQITGTNFSSWYVNGPGTVIAEFVNQPMAVNTRIWDISVDGTYFNSTYVAPYDIYNSLDFGVIEGGSFVTEIQINHTFAPNTVTKTGMAWATNDVAAVIDGGTVTTDTSSTISTRQRLALGSYGGASYFLTGWFKRWRYYNVRKTNTELQALTYPFADLTQTLDLDFTLGALDPRVTFTRTTTATYTDRAGLIQTSGINGARFDHDPVTHAGRGLLIEEQRTNVVLQSGNLGNATNWLTFANGTGAISVTANSSTAPDGTTTAALVDINRAINGDYAQLYQNVTVAGSSPASFYFKAFAAGDIGKQIMIGWHTGATFSGITLVTLTANWVRYSVSSGIGCIQLILGYVPVTEGGPSSTGQVKFYAWGAQAESGGAFATSYIPTTSAAVTRAADSASMTGTNFSSWYNAGEGTFALELTDEQRNRTTIYICASLSGSAGDRFMYYLYLNNIQDELDAGGTQYTNNFIGTIAASSIKIASRLKTNDYAVSLNGAAVVADVSVTLPSLNELRFAVAQDGVTYPLAQGWFRRLRYYNVGKTNTELQALTAP